MTWFSSSSALFLALAVAFNVAHNSALKISTEYDGGKRVAIVVVALLLGLINALSFSRALERMTLSIAYPTFSGASIVLTLLVSVIAFNEHLDPLKLFGVFIIIAGVTLVFR